MRGNQARGTAHGLVEDAQGHRVLLIIIVYHAQVGEEGDIERIVGLHTHRLYEAEGGGLVVVLLKGLLRLVD